MLEKIQKRKNIGAFLLLSGILQFLIIFFIISSGYSAYGIQHTISYILYFHTIGDISEGIMGLLILISAILLKHEIKTITRYLMIITAISSVGVSIFRINVIYLHIMFTIILMFFGSILVLSTYKKKNIFGYFSLVMGVISFSGLIIFASGLKVPISYGATERIILYPLLIWGVIFAINLIMHSEKPHML